MDKQLAAQLYLLANKIQDNNLWLLSALEIIGKQDLPAILAAYRMILAGKIAVVEVTSSVDLNKSEQETITEKIQAKLANQELIFVFEVDQDVKRGLQIKIGDNQVDLTISNDILQII